jgi:hypothetical protein
MAINTLSLPIDIPWKRLCVSEDMIDRNVCDAQYPPKWRSSIAAFDAEKPTKPSFIRVKHFPRVSGRRRSVSIWTK